MIGTQRELFPAAVYRFYTLRSIQDEESCARVRRLWLAVLQRGLQDFAAAEDTEPGEQESAREWLFSEDETSLGSFRSICPSLDINSDHILAHLEKIDEDGLRSLRKSGFDDVY